MKIKTILLFLFTIALVSCKTSYRVSNISGHVVAMDSSFDSPKENPMRTLVNSYKTELDREMGEVIGVSSHYMEYGRPESLLTNLTSDVMKAYGDEHLPTGADVGVMNVHGHRATLPKGKITVGNLFEIYSFDNTITFLELKGSELSKIFDAYARIGGAGISSNVKLVIENRKVKSVTLDGKSIDPNRMYHVVTLDYLAEGNDSMAAFKNAVKKTDTGITLRDVMIDYVKDQTRRGKEITSQLDERITVIK